MKGDTQNTQVALMSLDQCLKCNICLSHCPVAAVTGEFPGPKYIGPQAERFRTIESGPELSPMLCNGCGVCTSIFPNGVAITDIITLAKGEITKGGSKISVGQRLLNRP
jgi:glycerol-3-phosphate dehydrogenase subunit C